MRALYQLRFKGGWGSRCNCGSGMFETLCKQGPSQGYCSMQLSSHMWCACTYEHSLLSSLSQRCLSLSKARQSRHTMDYPASRVLQQPARSYAAPASLSPSAFGPVSAMACSCTPRTRLVRVTSLWEFITSSCWLRSALVVDWER